MKWGSQRLILDLRGNPGGLLSEGVGVADKFLKKGQLIVSHHGRASAEKRYVAQAWKWGERLSPRRSGKQTDGFRGGDCFRSIQGSGSRMIAGEVTFGKGLVQTVYPLSENTGLALTTAHYYTPSGRLIQRDYSNISLYDYYYNRDAESGSNANRDIKLTDSGRTVYGGGGITPDVVIPPIKGNHFQGHAAAALRFFQLRKRYV